MLELARCSYYNVNDILDDEGNIRTDDPDKTAAIAGMRVECYHDRQGNKNYKREYKFVDKNKSNELLARLGGFLNDRLDVNVKIDEFKQIEIVDLSSKTLSINAAIAEINAASAEVEDAEMIAPDLDAGQ